MPDQNLSIALAERPRRLDVLLALDRERLCAGDPREPDPVDQPDDDDDRPREGERLRHLLGEPGDDERIGDIDGGASPEPDQRDREHERGEREAHVREPHQPVVDPTAVVPRDQPDRHADRRREDGPDHAHEQGGPGAVDEPREHVPAQLVGPEWELRLGVNLDRLRDGPDLAVDCLRGRLLGGLAEPQRRQLSLL